MSRGWGCDLRLVSRTAPLEGHNEGMKDTLQYQPGAAEIREMDGRGSGHTSKQSRYTV